MGWLVKLASCGSNRATLPVCEVGIFGEKLLKMHPLPLLEEPLEFFANGCIFDNTIQYGTCKYQGSLEI